MENKEEYLTASMLAALLNLAPRTIHRRAADPGFPRPLNCGSRTRRWAKSEVVAYFKNARYERKERIRSPGEKKA